MTLSVPWTGQTYDKGRPHPSIERNIKPKGNNMSTYEPRVYVGTYAKYNNGSIAGQWVDLDGLDKDSFYEKCAEIHSDEDDPEYMFQDFEGFPRPFYGESRLSDALWDWLEMDNYDQELVARYQDAIGDADATLEDAKDAFRGTAESYADFAENYAEEFGDVPKDFPSWIVIDWEASWNCNLRYDFSTSEAEDGTIYFFH